MKHWFTYPRTVNLDYPEFLNPDSLARVATAGEAAGFSGIGFTDHPAPSHEWLNSPYGHDALDPFVALAVVAGLTEQIRLISNIVVLPYRNPFIVAKAAATLDALSGGRFILCVARGYLESEYRALGVDFERRNAIFDESLAAIRGVWSQDEFSFETEEFSAERLTVYPKPENVPIWIGGNSAISRRRVAAHGDGWNPFTASSAEIAKFTRTERLSTLEELAPQLDHLWDLVEAAGRDRGAIDVAFTNPLPGPASPDFDAAVHLESLARLTELGVTWTSTVLPRTSVDEAVEAIERYGAEVIAASP